MSRNLMTILLSSALVFGSVSTSAWSATDLSGGTQIASVQSDDPAENRAPLPPAGAAGIKQAQGFIRTYPLLSIAIAAGVIALIWVLVDDNNNDETSSTY